MGFILPNVTGNAYGNPSLGLSLALSPMVFLISAVDFLACHEGTRQRQSLEICNYSLRCLRSLLLMVRKWQLKKNSMYELR